MMSGISIFLFIVLTVVTAAAGADPTVYWNVQWENDIFTGKGTDRHYTNGLRLSHLRGEDRVPRWMVGAARAMPWFPEGGRVRGSWALGQNLYTPEDIQTDQLVVDDRPYAAWLYLGSGLVMENGRILDLLELSIGVVGPAAGGEATQKGIHRAIGSPDPRGWSHQLPNELAVQAVWQRKWRPLYGEVSRGWGFDALPHVGAALGNVFIYGAAGGTVRFGLDLSRDYGPPRIQPSLPGSEYFRARRGFGGYLFVGAEARTMLRNIFLDGSTFQDSHAVEKRFLVADVQAGLALIWNGVRLAYTYVVRTDEFVGQRGTDAFGAFTLSVGM